MRGDPLPPASVWSATILADATSQRRSRSLPADTRRRPPGRKAVPTTSASCPCRNTCKHGWRSKSCKERVSGFHGIGKVKGRYAQQEREIELPRYETLRREGQLLGCSHSPPSPFLLLGFLLRAKPGRLDIADVDALQVGRQSHTIIVKISYLPPLLAFLAAIASKVVP